MLSLSILTKKKKKKKKKKAIHLYIAQHLRKFTFRLNSMLKLPSHGRKEGNVLFNDALNTFYLRLYGVGHMVKERENVLFNESTHFI